MLLVLLDSDSSKIGCDAWNPPICECHCDENPYPTCSFNPRLFWRCCTESVVRLSYLRSSATVLTCRRSPSKVKCVWQTELVMAVTYLTIAIAIAISRPARAIHTSVPCFGRASTPNSALRSLPLCLIRAISPALSRQNKLCLSIGLRRCWHTSHKPQALSFNLTTTGQIRRPPLPCGPYKYFTLPPKSISTISSPLLACGGLI